MSAIIKRELYAYFSSPVGFIYIGVVYFLSGIFLVMGAIGSGSADLRPVFSSLLTVIMFLTPILTMRLMSEDRRRRTDQLLLTSPVALGAIIFGKFIAAGIVYILAISVTLIYAAVLSFFASIDWAIILGNYIALVLAGFAFISIGQFISSLTESQVVAAIGTFAAILGILFLDALPLIIPDPLLASIIKELSFTMRFTPITSGILSISNLFFFISILAIFLFLTTRVLEKRRWS